MAVVTSSQFQRELDRLQDVALTEPVTITQDGHERLVLLSATEYRRLKRGERRVGLTTDLSDDWIDVVRSAKAPEAQSDSDTRP